MGGWQKPPGLLRTGSPRLGRWGSAESRAISSRLLGEITSHPARLEVGAAEAHYHQALALAEELSLRPLVAHCHLGLGTLYGRTGKRQQAQEHLVTAATMYREMGMAFWLEKAEAAGSALR